MSIGFKGQHHTEETKKSISESNKGRHFSPNTEFKSGKNNPNFGKHLSKEIRKKIGLAQFGEKNPRWKGDKISNRTLHEWIRKYKSKPDLCEECKEIPPIDVANISGKYKRDIKDYRWLCRSCHMKSDGRLKESIKRLDQHGKNKIKLIAKRNKEIGRKCPFCGSFNIVKRGFTEQKRQRFGCKDCNIRF